MVPLFFLTLSFCLSLSLSVHSFSNRLLRGYVSIKYSTPNTFVFPSLVNGSLLLVSPPKTTPIQLTPFPLFPPFAFPDTPPQHTTINLSINKALGN